MPRDACPLRPVTSRDLLESSFITASSNVQLRSGQVFAEIGSCASAHNEGYQPMRVSRCCPGRHSTIFTPSLGAAPYDTDTDHAAAMSHRPGRVDPKITFDPEPTTIHVTADDFATVSDCVNGRTAPRRRVAVSPVDRSGRSDRTAIGVSTPTCRRPTRNRRCHDRSAIAADASLPAGAAAGAGRRGRSTLIAKARNTVSGGSEAIPRPPSLDHRS